MKKKKKIYEMYVILLQKDTNLTSLSERPMSKPTYYLNPHTYGPLYNQPTPTHIHIHIHIHIQFLSCFYLLLLVKPSGVCTNALTYTRIAKNKDKTRTSLFLSVIIKGELRKKEGNVYAPSLLFYAGNLIKFGELRIFYMAQLPFSRSSRCPSPLF